MTRPGKTEQEPNTFQVSELSLGFMTEDHIPCAVRKSPAMTGLPDLHLVMLFHFLGFFHHRRLLHFRRRSAVWISGVGSRGISRIPCSGP